MFVDLLFSYAAFLLTEKCDDRNIGCLVTMQRNGDLGAEAPQTNSFYYFLLQRNEEHYIEVERRVEGYKRPIRTRRSSFVAGTFRRADPGLSNDERSRFEPDI